MHSVALKKDIQKKHIGIVNIGAALVAAALIMQFAGDLSDPRGILLLVLF